MKQNKTVIKQIVSAICMALMGIGIHTGSQSYLSSYDLPITEPAWAADTKPAAVVEETRAAERQPVIIEEEETGFIPSLTSLNLAAFYPEEADRTDAMNSMAGQMISELSQKDSEWLAAIYDLSNRTPKEIASALGLPASAVRGRYNPSDESQSEDNPDSWLLSEWSHIDMVFTDENGNQIMADSNIKEIMAIANTYFYYIDPEDEERFYSYALELWEKSHSFRYSVGEVYYCDGCLYEENINRSSEETSGDAGTAGTEVDSASADDDTAANTTAPVSESAETTASDNGGTPETSFVSAPAEETVAHSTSAAFDAGTVGTSLAGNDLTESDLDGNGIAGSDGTGSGVTESESTESAESDSPGPTASANHPTAIVPETEPEIGPGIALMESTSAVETLPLEVTKEEVESEEIVCPGHVDLHITAVVTGMSTSDHSLFSLADSLTYSHTVRQSNEFTGWNDENRKAAEALAAQDWKAAYHLTVSSGYISNPLSSSEIASYMNLLPSDISAERKNLIRYALSSVGTIPYYWGGKPGAPDYDGNHFGMLTVPDEKGRSMKGLDCSGWINWIYWSATGNDLPCESTDGLAHCGTAVLREELKPGDIIVKLGDSAHVVMFLAWESNGKMKVIHESSGSVNNVTVSTMQADWPYYRKLID